MNDIYVFDWGFRGTRRGEEFVGSYNIVKQQWRVIMMSSRTIHKRVECYSNSVVKISQFEDHPHESVTPLSRFVLHAQIHQCTFLYYPLSWATRAFRVPIYDQRTSVNWYCIRPTLPEGMEAGITSIQDTFARHQSLQNAIGRLSTTTLFQGG
jgi:hypothetical protein